MSVYFVQAGDGGRIKIGLASSPKHRIDFLRRFSGPDLLELAVIEGSGALEHALHALLAEHHAHGEWFEPTPEVVATAQSAAFLQNHPDYQAVLYSYQFTTKEIEQLCLVPGVIGKAALEVRRFPSAHTINVLAGLILLLLNRPNG